MRIRDIDILVGQILALQRRSQERLWEGGMVDEH
jgi:hypothetical protein